MLERAEGIVKLLCLALGVALVIGIARIPFRANPLGSVSIPDIPQWSPPSNAISTSAASPPGPGPMAFPGPGPGRPRGRPGPGGGPAGPPLPPELQRRDDRIVQSGLLGPVIHPPPMALLGIAGDQILFRAPNGQTGLLKQGEELGGVRLLRIGTNYVLLEENGQTKELSMFGGLGGQSLLPKGNESHP